ncbi:MAG TPA: hypothetical protein VGO13_12770 [Solirubrobacterales bacterium]|jgi:hypothetical protein|nr:hypothetical protein [Solirubrobacterales bacterium]
MSERRTLDLIVREPESSSSLLLSSVAADDDFVDLRGSVNLFEGGTEAFQADIAIQIKDDEGVELARSTKGDSAWRFIDSAQGIELGPPIEDYKTESFLGVYELHGGRIAIDDRTFDAFSVSDPFPIIAVAAIVIGGALLSQAMILGTTAYVYVKQGKTPIITSGAGLTVKDGVSINFKLDVHPK